MRGIIFLLFLSLCNSSYAEITQIHPTLKNVAEKYFDKEIVKEAEFNPKFVPLKYKGETEKKNKKNFITLGSADLVITILNRKFSKRYPDTEMLVIIDTESIDSYGAPYIPSATPYIVNYFSPAQFDQIKYVTSDGCNRNMQNTIVFIKAGNKLYWNNRKAHIGSVADCGAW